MKKRILSVLLALCMCLTFVPVSVFAEDLQQDNSISVLSITPDEGTYRTYVFKANGETISTQIVKNGDTLLEPQVPAQDGKVFTGWSSEVTFGLVSNVNKTETITAEAQFADGYHVYFKDDSGRIIATETVTNGTKVTFEDVNFPVGNDEAITGWYTNKDYTIRSTPSPSMVPTSPCMPRWKRAIGSLSSPTAAAMWPRRSTPRTHPPRLLMSPPSPATPLPVGTLTRI